MQLEILTDDEQYVRICEDYWRQDEKGKFLLQVREVASIHSMQSRTISQLVKKYAYAWSAADCCRVCIKPYQYRIRSEYQERYRELLTVCKDCREIEQQVIADKKKNILMKLRLARESKAIALESLDWKSTVYLLATVHALWGEGFGIVDSLCHYPSCTLSPDFDYDLKILVYLFENGLLLPSLNTNLDAIELDDYGEVRHLHLEMFTFDLPWEYQQCADVWADFFDDSALDSVKKTTDFAQFCREVQLRECTSFLMHVLDRHDLYISPGEKTKEVLNLCLEKLSVAQVYNFIWRAARDAAAYYMRSSISKGQAANSAIGNMRRSLEQSQAEGWDVKPFSRNHNMPQSLLSVIVFNMMLDTEDGGFNQPLHELIGSKSLLRI